MKVMNFETLKVENVNRYKEISLKLVLDKKLDMKYSEFTEDLYVTIGDLIKRENLQTYENPIVFHIHTDLDRSELKMLRDLIIGVIVDEMIVTKGTFKHREQRLGRPDEFETLDIMQGHLMDLVNYPLVKEQFNIYFYDAKDRVYKPVVKVE